MIKKIFVALGIVLFVWSINATAQPAQKCGGTERWFVKTGIDPDAPNVDLNNVVPITVEDLNKLPSLRDQVRSGDNQLRLPEETVVYRVAGRIVMFKHEADGDYHLVITNDSLNYTPGGDGTDGMETGTSFIAEIPDPNCVAGKKGPSDAKSQWQDRLKAVRDQFEARFSIQDANKNLGGIPVTLTGVLFYDRQHLQVGRAVNGAELHPLLDISFDNTTSPISSPTITSTNNDNLTQLLANPGFEEGVTGWSGTIDDIGTYQSERAHGGGYFAWMGGTGSAHSESLYQSVTIPSYEKKATLALWLSIQTEETAKTKAHDKLYLQIKDKNGHVLKNLETFSDLNKNDDYERHEYDLSPYIGQDITVFLKASENEGRATSFKVDDITLTVQ